jgi:IS5 family transposase
VKKKKTKTTYRLRNWKQYNNSLVQRGSLTIWFSDDMITDWINQEKSGKAGRSNNYSDTAILCMATIGEVYNLRLRQTEGLMLSVMKMLKLELSVPDYSTLCRRRNCLEIVLPRLRRGESAHVVVDSTGVKVFGEGEWKVRQHGYSRRRTWRKLHLGVDEASGEIVAAVVATNNFTDGQVLPDLLEQIDDEIRQVSGDKGYDKRDCYKAIGARKARAAIPPRKGARIWQHGNSKAERHIRDENLRRIRAVGRKQWKKEAGYHRRSLAETAM